MAALHMCNDLQSGDAFAGILQDGYEASAHAYVSCSAVLECFVNQDPKNTSTQEMRSLDADGGGEKNPARPIFASTVHSHVRHATILSITTADRGPIPK
jgi:hypothetical protein